jgi:predicted TIM-barrel fold metal-dependent hydrolase
MSNATASLANPLIRGIGPIQDRRVTTAYESNLPAGTKVISADNHWEITEDIFFDNFPARLKDKAPRVWFDAFWRIGYRGTLEGIPIGEKMKRAVARTTGDGVSNLDVRYRDMDTDGVQGEIVFPQSLLGVPRFPEFEVQELLYRIYNEHMAQRFKGSRSHPVGVFSNWWDPAAAERAMQQIIDLGLKTFMVPITPGKSIDGKNIAYSEPLMDRFWDVVADAGLPVCFHIGEGANLEPRGGCGITNLVMIAPFRRPFAELVFGGVFDRHPKLQVVFAEGGISWVPPALQDAESIFDNFGNGDIVDRLDHRPSHYWHNNCYATFQNDALGLSQLHYLGADRVMWAADYPHSEGTFGYGQAALNAVAAATNGENTRAILGGNAVKVFGLDA